MKNFVDYSGRTTFEGKNNLYRHKGFIKKM